MRTRRSPRNQETLWRELGGRELTRPSRARRSRARAFVPVAEVFAPTNHQAMTREEADLAMRLAIGRVMRMMSRPEQPGDAEMFHACRAIVQEAAEVLGIEPSGVSGELGRR